VPLNRVPDAGPVYLLARRCSVDDYFRPVPGYPNYLVSRRGEVWSIARRKMLSQVEGRRGYMLVNLYRGGRVRNFLVHRLVAMTFIGRIPPGKQINHRDGDKRNNRADNLEIVTPEENREHAKRTGLVVRGEDNPSARLSEKDVLAIRRMRAEGVRVRDIANTYDVSERTVYMLCRRKTWRHVE
jgi:hypothetical protein